MGLKEIQQDVDNMTKVFEMQPEAGAEELRTDPPPTDAPNTVAPGTNAPGTKAPGTSAPATSAPATNAPGTEAPGTEAPSTEVPEEDPRDKEIRELRTKLAEKEAPKPTAAPPTAAPSTEAPIAAEDFLGSIDLDELTRDPALFNEVLNKLHKSAVEIARTEVKKGNEFVIRSVPDITKNFLALSVELERVKKKFYDDNEDLKPFQKVVGAVFEEMIAENPGKKYDDLLPDLATETRTRLDLHKKAVNRQPKGDPPPLPRKKGAPRKQTKPNTGSLETELNAMDEVLDT